MKLASLVAGLALTGAVIVPPAQAQTPQRVVVQQQDVVVSPTGNDCPVAFVEDGYAYVDAVCGDRGDVFTHAETGAKIGQFHTPWGMGPYDYNGFGFIALDSAVARAGDNPDSGNQIVPRTEVEVGDEVCSVEGCTEITATEATRVWADGTLAGHFAWIPGKGFVGMVGFTDELKGATVIHRVDTVFDGTDFRTYHPGPGVGDVIDTSPWIPTTIAINQGDAIHNSSDGGCTIGYVEPGILKTAAHCGTANEIMRDATYNLPVGRLVRTPDVVPGSEDDSAYIEITNPRFVAGTNTYSGDAIAPFDVHTKHEKACTYGATTQKVLCGTIFTVSGTEVLIEGTETDFGDSGGPIWVPGKGFLGTLYGSMGTSEGVMTVAYRHDMVQDKQGLWEYSPKTGKGKLLYTLDEIPYPDDGADYTPPLETRDYVKIVAIVLAGVGAVGVAVWALLSRFAPHLVGALRIR